jgi:D-3-phosphoglycerate dehydrogenase / 2-oxoglutarate reductase
VTDGPVVLVTDYDWPALDIEERLVATIPGATLIGSPTSTDDELIARAAGANALLVNWRKIPAAALVAAPDCVIVSQFGTGVDHIPVDEATRLGILVANVPDYCLDEVSDHALALLLASARRIVELSRATRSGIWDSRAGSHLPRVRGQTLGLIGYGAIGRKLVPKAAALGLQIVAYTPRITTDAVAPYGRGTTDLDEVLRSADFVSIHTKLTEETRGLIGERELHLMKPTATLINTARGPIVDEQALVRALTEGWIAAAAVDVLDQEPPDPGHPLLALDNVIVTPHVAFASAASDIDMRTFAVENVLQALRGERPKNLVNPEVLQRPNCRFVARS